MHAARVAAAPPASQAAPNSRSDSLPRLNAPVPHPPQLVPGWPRLPRHELAGLLLVSAVLLTLTLTGLIAQTLPEVLGFVTGAVCVWLVVREHLLNFPIGLLNNLAFGVLFWHVALYADMGLQAVYFALGVYGWWSWVRGGAQGTPLRVTRATRAEWLGLALFLPLGTLAMREALLLANGAAPLWDAFTTALSLGAQYLLCRKRLENWLLWIVADVIYVPLYVSRELTLTAVLYAGLLLLCLAGLRTWRRSLERAP